MSNNHDRRARDYSKYDFMSTEQLQEILRLDAHQTDGTGMDTEELFYIMEVVTKRRKSNPETAGKSVEEAKAEFRKHYITQEETKTIAFPVWLRRAATIAAVLAIFMVVATTSVNAFGYDLWGKIAIWSQEFFHFEDETQETESDEPGKQDDFNYSSLQEALDGMGILQQLAPTWLPEGYVLSDLQISRSPRENSIYANYENGDANIGISIRQLIGSQPQEIEKSEDSVLAYDVNGITYYILNNYDELKAIWVVEDFECFISGNITAEEMKAIIDSI